jgi:GT2 family glycosyltransferase
MKNKIAILLTCHNRREKTLACLNALYTCQVPENYELDVYLVDDGSTDGTLEFVNRNYPLVNIIKGNGNLFWAGGMRLAWREALKQKFDGFLLLNDDTILHLNAIEQLIEVHNYSLEKNKKGGIYIGSVKDPDSEEYSYGGHKLMNNLSGNSKIVKPSQQKIQECDFANGNILFVSQNVVESIGILSDKFTHFLADYDYTLTAKKNGFPVLVCSSYCGTCENDHDKNWLSAEYSLSERIKYLKNPKYLAYNEYLYYIKRHFPYYWPIAFLKLWSKTLLPSIWDKFKK